MRKLLRCDHLGTYSLEFREFMGPSKWDIVFPSGIVCDLAGPHGTPHRYGVCLLLERKRQVSLVLALHTVQECSER